MLIQHQNNLNHNHDMMTFIQHAKAHIFRGRIILWFYALIHSHALIIVDYIWWLNSTLGSSVKFINLQNSWWKTTHKRTFFLRILKFISLTFPHPPLLHSSQFPFQVLPFSYPFILFRIPQMLLLYSFFF